MIRTLRRLIRPPVPLRGRTIMRTAKSGSLFWRVMAIAILARRYAKKYLGKHPEHLTTDRVAIGQSLTVSAIQPNTRRAARRARKVKVAGTAL